MEVFKEDNEPDLSQIKIVKRVLKDAFDTFIFTGNSGKVGPMGRRGRKPHPSKRRPENSCNLTGMKFNFTRAFKFLNGLGISMFFGEAALLAGVQPHTVQKWIRRGDQVSESDPDKYKNPYYVFAKAAEALPASTEAAHLSNIHKTALRAPTIDGAKLSMAFLRMRHPGRYAVASNVDVTTKGDKLPDGGRTYAEVVVKYVDAGTATQEGITEIEAVKPEDHDEVED